MKRHHTTVSGVMLGQITAVIKRKCWAPQTVQTVNGPKLHQHTPTVTVELVAQGGVEDGAFVPDTILSLYVTDDTASELRALADLIEQARTPEELVEEEETHS